MQQASDEVGAIIVPGYDLESSLLACRLAERSETLYASVGVHPDQAGCWEMSRLDSLRELLSRPKAVAVGEIGLDYHWHPEMKDKQIETLAAQLELAAELDKPVILHCRDAHTDLLDLLEIYQGKLRGVMHCWTGSMNEAIRAIGIGMYLGFGGLITFKKNVDAVQDVAMKAPTDRILLETDAPYLAPVPHRGRRNEPSYLPLIAKRLAEIRLIPVEEIRIATSQNAARLFNLPES
ncbi:MAG: TatD family hydrolase [Armatimonadetes bacterium]|nr:TatD family hydrolase [Armatimonadota bacterium]